MRSTFQSVCAQRLPVGWSLRVVIVDDESPVGVEDEISRSDLLPSVELVIIHQKNSGVAGARNAGLDYASADSDVLAFLDSDDVWPADYVAKAIGLIELGYDFVFSDNVRSGVHFSNLDLCVEARRYIDGLGLVNGVKEIPKEAMIGFCITEFPCQASTVVYRCEPARDLRFKKSLQYSGEDVLFFTELLRRCSQICFNPQNTVECGAGVNIYYGNLNWNSPRFLGIKVDQVLTHRALSRADLLTDDIRALNKSRLSIFYRELNFHLYRSIVKRPRLAVKEFARLVRNDWMAGLMVCFRLPHLPGSMK